MQYQEYIVHPQLKPFVKVIWSMESNAPIWNIPTLRILPDTCIELVVHYNDPYKTTFSDNKSSIQQRSLIVGQMKSFTNIQLHGKVGFIAVRFSAWDAYQCDLNG